MEKKLQEVAPKPGFFNVWLLLGGALGLITGFLVGGFISLLVFGLTLSIL